jgi:hypothetical protein
VKRTVIISIRNLEENCYNLNKKFRKERRPGKPWVFYTITWRVQEKGSILPISRL